MSEHPSDDGGERGALRGCDGSSLRPPVWRRSMSAWDTSTTLASGSFSEGCESRATPALGRGGEARHPRRSGHLRIARAARVLDLAVDRKRRRARLADRDARACAGTGPLPGLIAAGRWLGQTFRQLDAQNEIADVDAITFAHDRRLRDATSIDVRPVRAVQISHDEATVAIDQTSVPFRHIPLRQRQDRCLELGLR